MALTADLFPPDLPPGFSHLPAVVPKIAQIGLFEAVQQVAETAKFTNAQTKSGGVFGAEITNCGRVGWWSDERGYRYTEAQPDTGAPWPEMPAFFTKTLKGVLKGTQAEGFAPDACLINHYVKGTKMGLHQDKDEADFNHPIVTICLGAAADFQIGGLKRGDMAEVIIVESGDVLIMGGDSRMRFHGIRKIYPGTSPIDGLDGRISLTFRRAL